MGFSYARHRRGQGKISKKRFRLPQKRSADVIFPRNIPAQRPGGSHNLYRTVESNNRRGLRKPEKRTTQGENGEVEVYIPLVPARARTKEGYISELNGAGFTVEDFIEMDINVQCPYSASIYARKPVLL